ncbi:MAG: MCE family protein [Candidatus Aminicenantes bacterium]|nr:MCE family protein [Candidatus Aminicenantes bacterium]
MTREAKIGIFLGGTILIIATLIFIVGDLSTWFKKPGYSLSAYFPSVTGLENRAAVRLAGVKIGYVRDIQLAERRARLTLNIFPQFQVPRGSKAAMASLGLIGEKYIEITPSDDPAYHAPGETLESTAAVSFDQLGVLLLSIGEEIEGVSQSLRQITGEESQKNLQEILRNLNSFSGELDGFLKENREGLQTGIQGASQAVREFDRTVGDVSQSLDETIRLVKEIAQENRDGIKSNLGKIDELLLEIEESVRLLRNTLDKIDRGEGTVGRLVQDPGLYEQARETLDGVRETVGLLRQMRATGHFRGDYLGETQKVRGAVSAAFYLTPRSFLSGQIVDDPRRDGFVYSAQAGLRFGPLVPRAGIIESEFGAGMDLLALGDRLMFSLEGFDFQRDEGPRFRLAGQFSLLRYLHLILGVDDLGLDSRREVFFGLGLGTR